MRVGAVLVVAMASGCFAPAPATGLPCSPEGECPSGQTCIADVCEGHATIDAPVIVDGPRVDAPADADVGPDAPPPAGDTCATAIQLPPTMGTIPGSFAGAQDDFDPPVACGASDGAELVYRFDFVGQQLLRFRVTGVGVNGTFYSHPTCPPIGVSVCGPINGGSAGATYATGPVYLVVERAAGTTGMAFELVVETE